MDIKLLKRNGFMSKRLLQVSVIALIGAFYAMPITYYTTKILRVCGILPWISAFSPIVFTSVA